MDLELLLVMVDFSNRLRTIKSHFFLSFFPFVWFSTECIYVNNMYALCAQLPEKSLESPWKLNYKLPMSCHGCLLLNSEPSLLHSKEDVFRDKHY